VLLLYAGKGWPYPLPADLSCRGSELVMAEREPASTLADKISKLFAASHRRGERPIKVEEVVETINSWGGVTISTAYLYLLKSGKRDNPGKAHLEALARYFGVSPAYFFDDAIAREVDAQLTLLMAMREAGVAHLALRAAALSPAAREAIAGMVEHARRLEGLLDGEANADPAAPSPGRQQESG